MHSYCTPVLSEEEFPHLKLSGGRGPGRSFSNDQMTRTAKARAKKDRKVEALRLMLEKELKEKEGVMEKKKVEREMRMMKREEARLAKERKEAEKREKDEKKEGLERMKFEKAEKKKAAMENKLAKKAKEVGKKTVVGRKRKSGEEQKDRLEEVDDDKENEVPERKKKASRSVVLRRLDGGKKVDRVGGKQDASMPETGERVALANHPFAPPEACRASLNKSSGSDFQPEGVEVREDVPDKARSTRVARRGVQKNPEANANEGVPRLRKTRFLREVAVMKIERLERSGTKMKRKLQAGPMFGEEEVVPLKRPGTTASLARRVTQAKIRSWLGAVPESLDSPTPVASSGCAATCFKTGCAENCECRKNGIECFDEAGCLCEAHNCTNERRPEIYGDDVRRAMVEKANADFSFLSGISEDTIVSVDRPSPVRNIARRAVTLTSSPPVQNSPIASPSLPVQAVPVPVIPPAAAPKRARRDNISSGIDLGADKCSATLSAFLPLLLDANNFSSVQNSSRVKLLTGEAVFLGLAKEATKANAHGACISVMHPDSFYRWRTGAVLDRDELMESIYFREEIETLLIPLHTGTIANGHWSLAALFVREGRVTIYDPLSTTKAQQQERIAWLSGLLEVLLPRDQYAKIRMRYAYQHQRDVQTDTVNCGMHLIINARRIAEGRRNLASKDGERVNMREERTVLHKSLLAAGREYTNAAHDPNRQILMPSLNAPPVALNRNKRR